MATKTPLFSDQLGPAAAAVRMKQDGIRPAPEPVFHLRLMKHLMKFAELRVAMRRCAEALGW